MRWVLLALATTLVAACGGDDGTLADATYEAQRATNEARLALTPTATATNTATPDPSATASPTPGTVGTPATFATGASATSQPTATATATASPTIAPTPQPVALSGSGALLTDPVTLPGGLAVITMRHEGSERFAITLLNTTGATVSILTNSNSPFLGSRGVVIPGDGEYVFEVAASGPWTIDIHRPIPPESIVSDVPFEQSGTGSQAVYFVRVPPGLHRVSATHDGERTFAVTVTRSDGTNRDRVIDATGAFDGSGAIVVNTEPFEYILIDIMADGNWTVRID